MRLLHAIPTTDLASGGPIEAIRQGSIVLTQMGHKNEIVCLDSPEANWLGEIGIPVHPLGPAFGKRYRFSRPFVRWLRKYASRYDCVIVHGIWTFADAGTHHALRRSRIPYFVYAHGMLDPVFHTLFPWKRIKKTLYWWLVENRVLRDARAVLFTCDEERDLAAKSYWPRNWRSAVVPYCVNPAANGPLDHASMFLLKYPELAKRRLILFLSRIHPKKGCDALIEAFSHVARADPSIQLVMAGPGDPPEWASGLQKRAGELGITHRITWTGMLKGHEKWSALRAAEVFILPSHQENFGIAVVEALACGTPVLITRGVNIWREVTADGAGLAASSGVDGTLELLTNWLALDATAVQSMRVKAAECFAKRFDSHRAAQVLVETLADYGVK